MKKVIFAIILMTLLNVSNAAFALPDLQVYIPGSTAMDYGSDEETWFVPTIPGWFELKVVASYGPNDRSITNGTLLVTVPQGQSGTISGLGAGTFHTDLSFLPDTTPSLTHYPLNSPGVYDFFTFNIGSFAANTPVTLPNYNAGTGNITYENNATGEIKTYTVTLTGYSYLHLDAYALYEYKQGRSTEYGWRANQGSHDSAADPDISRVPEPATMSLLGLGIAGLLGFKRKSK